MLTLHSYTNQNVLAHTILSTITPINGDTNLNLTPIQNPVIPEGTPSWLLGILQYGAAHPQLSLEGVAETGLTVELVSYTVQNLIGGTMLDTHTVLGHFAAGEQVNIDIDAAEALLTAYSGPVTPLIQYALEHPQFRLVVTPDAPAVELVGVIAPQFAF